MATKYKKWVNNDEKLALLEGLARDGATDEELAMRIGIAPKTLYEWKKKFPRFARAIDKGKEVIDRMVERKLLDAAMSGNVTAQIFWLKNRRPDQWLERKKIDLEGQVSVKIIDDI